MFVHRYKSKIRSSNDGKCWDKGDFGHNSWPCYYFCPDTHTSHMVRLFPTWQPSCINLFIRMV